MKALWMCCLVTTALASAALAGVDLSWDACSSDGGAANRTFTCDGTGGPYAMVVNFQPSADLPNFIALEVEINLRDESSPTSAFWAFETGGCNHGALRVTADAAGVPCTAESLWGPGGTEARFLAFDYYRYGNYSRIMAAVGREVASTIPLITAGTNYYVLTLLIEEDNAPSCSGCEDPVAIVVNQLNAYSTTHATLAQSSPGLRGTCITANGGSQATCSAVPARNRTWGSLKSLYR